MTNHQAIYECTDEFLEDAMISMNPYEEQDADYDAWNSKHKVYVLIRINNF
jgi:hypothetical protein